MTWLNVIEAYARLPEFIQARITLLRPRHSIEASVAAVMPIEKRLALKAQYPDIKRADVLSAWRLSLGFEAGREPSEGPVAGTHDRLLRAGRTVLPGSGR
jgi:hypothetical protein